MYNFFSSPLFQLKKIGDSVPSVSTATFDQAWHTVLSEVFTEFI